MVRIREVKGRHLKVEMDRDEKTVTNYRQTTP